MITNGQIADADEVKPTLYGQFRDLIEKDKYYLRHRSLYRNNFIYDGFATSDWVSSSTSWTHGSTFSSSSRPVLYWTTTNASEIIGKTITFPSTISYATGFVDYWICETIDECNAGSGGIDTGIWDVILDTEESTQTYEGGGVLRLVAAETGGSGTSAECQVRTDNAVFDSTHRYLALRLNTWSANNSGGTGTADENEVAISLHDGTDSTTLFRLSGSNGFTTDFAALSQTLNIDNTAWTHNEMTKFLSNSGSQNVGGNYTIGGPLVLEAFYNADANMVDVHLNGFYYKSVSVSAVSPIKLDIYVQARRTASGGSPPNSNTTLDVDWVRKEKATPTSSLAFSMSANNGSNYTSIGHENETTISNTGTQVKPKLTATISSSEYIHVRGYAAMLR